MKNKDKKFKIDKKRNIRYWNGKWFCPRCKFEVGTRQCSCGLLYFVFESSKVVFFEEEKMKSFNFKENSVFAGNIFSAKQVDKNGNIDFYQNLPKRNNFLLKNIEFP